MSVCKLGKVAVFNYYSGWKMDLIRHESGVTMHFSDVCRTNVCISKICSKWGSHHSLSSVKTKDS